jgi:hypothetical protein
MGQHEAERVLDLIGQSGDWFLVAVGDGLHEGYGPFPLGRTYDRRGHRLSPPLPVDSILAHSPGYGPPKVDGATRARVLAEAAALFGAS